MAKSDPFRSGLERRNARRLQGHGIRFDYEPFYIPYIQPLKTRRYKPDFVLPNAIIVETKGHWKTKDRQKHKMIAETYPGLDIRFVFSRAHNTISKRSKTTYADYCESNGWLWADKEIPLSWVREPLNEKSAELIQRIMESPINQ